MRLPQERLLYRWHAVQSNGPNGATTRPSIKEGTLEQDIKRDADTRRKSGVPEAAERYRVAIVWIGGGIIIFLAASWITSVILPLSFPEVITAVVVSTLCAIVLVIVAAVVALWAIFSVVPRLLIGMNTSQ